MIKALRNLTILISVLAFPSIAVAQANRTWVSGIGDDVNPCSRSSPCKTYAGAISRTNVGGEIDALDPGGFGAVTITKSVTIDGGGVLAGTLASGTNGVNINITAAADAAKSVRLRNLSIFGMGAGNHGIRVLAANQVFVENVLIDGFLQHGIDATASPLFLSVKQSIIRNIGHNGLNLAPAAPTPKATVAIDSTQISQTEVAMITGRGVNATIQNSSLLRSEVGIQAEEADVTAVSCLVAHSGRAIFSRAGAVIRMSLMTITKNNVGLAAAGGRIVSYKNNVVDHNATDGTPTHFVNPV